MPEPCEHVSEIRQVTPAANGCEECRAVGAAFLTAVRCRRYLPNFTHMFARLGHWLRARRSGAKRDRRHLPTIIARSESEATVEGICCSARAVVCFIHRVISRLAPRRASVHAMAWQSHSTRANAPGQRRGPKEPHTRGQR